MSKRPGLGAGRRAGRTKLTVISLRHKFIFARPPKVASTSMLASLLPSLAQEDVVISDPWDRSRPWADDDQFGAIPFRNARCFPGLSDMRGGQSHIPPERIRRHVPERLWDECFKFTVVRNPWDWFVSLYIWKMRSDWPMHRLRDLRSGNRSLGAVLRTRYRLLRTLPNHALGRHPRNIEFMLKRKWFAELIDQLPAFYFLDGHPWADYCIRFEHLQRDYDELCRRLSLPRKRLPRTKNLPRDDGEGYRGFYTDWSREHIAGKLQRIADAFGYRF